MSAVTLSKSLKHSDQTLPSAADFGGARPVAGRCFRSGRVACDGMICRSPTGSSPAWQSPADCLAAGFDSDAATFSLVDHEVFSERLIADFGLDKPALTRRRLDFRTTINRLRGGGLCLWRATERDQVTVAGE